MYDMTYQQRLTTPCDAEEITRLSLLVFKEGKLDKIDDLIFSILPLCNVIYYKFIKRLDDGEYAKEDLISDAVYNLYRDMSYRWDKYIYVESYYDYYSKILRNSMRIQVMEYHNNYNVDEYDPEWANDSPDKCTKNAYEDVDMKLLRESIQKDINDTAKRILRCRKAHTNLLLNIFRLKYEEKLEEELSDLKSRVRILGISLKLFNFYESHVEYVYKLSYNYHYAILGGKSTMIDRISGTISRYEDVTYGMLSDAYYDSIIPEIYAEFGPDVAKRFVKTFSNKTVQVPDYKNFCDTLLGGIVMQMTDGNRDELGRVSEEYQLPYRSLSRIFNKALDYEKRRGNKDDQNT